MNQNQEDIPQLLVTSHMMKKSHISRWYYALFYIPCAVLLYPFVGFILGVILGYVSSLIIIGILFGFRDTLRTHFNYECPNCKYSMSFTLPDRESKLTDVIYKGRCPKCAMYHEVDYRYDGNMKILKD